MNSLMWTATTRAQHRRDGLRFASDTTDAELRIIAALLPPLSAVGRPPQWPLRAQAQFAQRFTHALDRVLHTELLPDEIPDDLAGPQLEIEGILAWILPDNKTA